MSCTSEPGGGENLRDRRSLAISANSWAILSTLYVMIISPGTLGRAVNTVELREKSLLSAVYKEKCIIITHCDFDLSRI